MGHTVYEKFFERESSMEKKRTCFTYAFLLICVSIVTNFCYGNKPKTLLLLGIGQQDIGLCKISDSLSKSYKIKHVARCQGSSGGHHLKKDARHKFRFCIIPSAIMNKTTECCYLTAGMEVDPKVILRELDFLHDKGIQTNSRLLISAKAHVVFPFHKELDACMASLTESSIDIGSRKGTGSAAACKRLRIGIRVADLLDEKRFKIALKELLEFANNMLVKLFDKQPYSFDELYTQYCEYARKLKPYVKDDVEIRLNKTILTSSESVLFEGAQGSSADLSFGAYPYVSSSSTSAAGILTGAGVGPHGPTTIVGVVPAYITALGGAPLATEMKDLFEMPHNVSQRVTLFPQQQQESLRKKYTTIVESCTLDSATIKKSIEGLIAFFKEIGLPGNNPLYNEKTLQKHVEDTAYRIKIEAVHTATHQELPDNVRYGWIDMVMIREAILLNSIDSLVLTKLDTLDDFDEIKICIDYKVGNKTYDYMPSLVDNSKNIEPVYITMKGWKKSTSAIKKFSQLPPEARDFIQRIHTVTSTPISYISVGPNPDQIIPYEPLNF